MRMLLWFLAFLFLPINPIKSSSLSDKFCLLTCIAGIDYVRALSAHNHAVAKKEKQFKQALNEGQAIDTSVTFEYKTLRLKSFLHHYKKKFLTFIDHPFTPSKQPWFSLCCYVMLYDFFKSQGAKTYQLSAASDQQQACFKKNIESLQGARLDDRARVLSQLPPFVFGSVEKDEAWARKRVFLQAIKKIEQGKKFSSVQEQLYEALLLQQQGIIEEKSKASSVICLVGEPGVGKTRFGSQVAQELGFYFYRLELGGGRGKQGHTDELKGHNATYQFSQQGGIVKALQETKSNNKHGLVILLDEIDKSTDVHALLSLLDPEQNRSFKDAFLDVPLDLSSIIVIATANDLSALQTEKALADRLRIIQVPSYTMDEKIELVQEILDDKDQKEFLECLVTFVQKEENKSFVKQLLQRYDAQESGLRTLFDLLSQVTGMLLQKEDLSQEDIFAKLESRVKISRKSEHDYSMYH